MQMKAKLYFFIFPVKNITKPIKKSNLFVCLIC
jgi:hypothetical protein